MIDTLLIYPDTSSGEAVLARRTRGVVEIVRGDLDALAMRLDPPYAIILPGQQVRAFLTDLPETIKGAERLSVARFAHEDRIATNLDQLHIVVGSGNPAPTQMLDNAVMDQLLSRFDPHMVLADFEALAGQTANQIACLDRVVQPGSDGCALDRDWAEGPITSLDDDSLTRAMFDRIDSGAALNLRSGVYRRRAQVQAGPWARIAAVALVCGLLGLALSLADARATSAQADALREQARSLYTQATGQAAPDNLARLARSTDSTAEDPTAFLRLSDHLFDALSRHPDITVDRLSYAVRENSLRLSLIYPDFDAASALEATVAEQGALFTPGGVREQNGRFIGDAALALGGAS